MLHHIVFIKKPLQLKPTGANPYNAFLLFIRSYHIPQIQSYTKPSSCWVQYIMYIY